SPSLGVRSASGVRTSLSALLSHLSFGAFPRFGGTDSRFPRVCLCDRTLAASEGICPLLGRPVQGLRFPLEPTEHLLVDPLALAVWTVRRLAGRVRRGAGCRNWLCALRCQRDIRRMLPGRHRGDRKPTD